MLQRVALVEQRVADLVDVHRRRPRMRRGVHREHMTRRPIPAVRRDVHELADGAPELLKTERQQRDRARHVSREGAQRLDFVDVGVDEFPEREMLRELHLLSDIPRRNFVEVARQLVRLPLRVAHHAAGPEHVAKFLLETPAVDDAQRDARLPERAVGDVGGVFSHRLRPGRPSGTRRSCTTRRQSSATGPKSPGPTP